MTRETDKADAVLLLQHFARLSRNPMDESVRIGEAGRAAVMRLVERIDELEQDNTVKDETIAALRTPMVCQPERE